MMAGMAFELPVAGGAPAQLAERVDAARNRQRILEVAAELIACRGIEQVSMHDIAEQARVGTGTLYRRFGGRAGLALALLDGDTQVFQDALLRGDAPLGPGAPAGERLRAFGRRYLELLEDHASLVLAGEPTGNDGRGPASFYLTHLAVLLREAAPGLDAEHTSRMLLAGLRPHEFLIMRRDLGWSLERLQDGWERMVDALLAGHAASATAIA
jgi:AcrR family transcriptional regulator